MLNENLTALRSAKGITQEELAIRLNVVRQTISKWEKGLSVPDADLLIRIADIFEVSVSELLGAGFDGEGVVEINAVAEQLMRINEQLAIRNNRSRRIWKTVWIILASLAAVVVLWILIAIMFFTAFKNNTDIAVESRDELITAE
ncbi:MAG: helix-turn-helix transcriptional regulator [Oscillospiraceae bacterium]|nr:helix-turn-helix transcriptional regulator [Oscillospiraceae bacterium]